MDSIKGAIELRALLAGAEDLARHTETPPASAPPVFAWLGVMPLQTPDVGDAQT